MPFDATKPANNSSVNSAELRAQFTSLKTLVDACPTTGAMQSYVLANSSGQIDSVGPLALVPSDPPTDAELSQVIFKLNELIAALKREPPS